MFEIITFDSVSQCMKIAFFLILIIPFCATKAQEQWTLQSTHDSLAEIAADTAQYDTIRSIEFTNEGKVTIHKDPRIDQVTLLERGNVTLIKSGYRVQVMLSQKKDEVNQLRAKFIKQNRGHNVYIVWQQPNFSLKIGDFYTRQQAMEFKYEISEQHPAAIVVKDNIQLPKLP
jgi:hypothetical protein